MSTCRNEVILTFTSIIKKKRQAQLPWQWYHNEFKNHLMLTAKNVLKMLKKQIKNIHKTAVTTLVIFGNRVND